jgi:hypothetical protein
LSLAGIAKASADYRGLGVHEGPVYTAG